MSLTQPTPELLGAVRSTFASDVHLDVDAVWGALGPTLRESTTGEDLLYALWQLCVPPEFLSAYFVLDLPSDPPETVGPYNSVGQVPLYCYGRDGVRYHVYPKMVRVVYHRHPSVPGVPADEEESAAVSAL